MITLVQIADRLTLLFLSQCLLTLNSFFVSLTAKKNRKNAICKTRYITFKPRIITVFRKTVMMHLSHAQPAPTDADEDSCLRECSRYCLTNEIVFHTVCLLCFVVIMTYISILSSALE